MSKPETTSPRENTRLEGQTARAEAVTAATAARQASGIRNMRMMTDLKAGSRKAPTPTYGCHIQY